MVIVVGWKQFSDVMMSGIVSLAAFDLYIERNKMIDWDTIKRYTIGSCIILSTVIVVRVVEQMSGYDLDYILGCIVGYGIAITVYWKELKK
jgi:hypothetical protein